MPDAPDHDRRQRHAVIRLPHPTAKCSGSCERPSLSPKSVAGSPQADHQRLDAGETSLGWRGSTVKAICYDLHTPRCKSHPTRVGPLIHTVVVSMRYSADSELESWKAGPGYKP